MTRTILALLVLALASLTGCYGGPETTSTTAQEARIACTLMQPYCPPECHLSEGGCPQQCHCDNGNYVLCGDRHCGPNEVCCTGPIVNDTPNYQCEPEGSVCPL